MSFVPKSPEEAAPGPEGEEARGSVLKPTQWAGAAAVLALMVFVLTFAMNYLGGNAPRQTAPRATELVRLDFATQDFPLKEGERMVCEVKKPNATDFRFRNPNDRPVKVGLTGKACKCSAVELYVPPPAWQERVLRMGGGVDLAALAGGKGADAEELKGLTPEPLEKDGPGGTVPAGAVGWVRLRWTGRDLGPQILDANLWTDRRDAGPTTTLAARVVFMAPLQLGEGKEVSVGALNASDLPRERTIVCWSPTRTSFTLKARPATVRGGRAASDPFEVGAPIPLTAEDRAQIERDLPAGVTVLSGYRIPVTLRPVSRDHTTPFDLGPFRRGVVLSSEDEGIDPEEVVLTGRVQGEVTVDTPSGEGLLRFGTFDRSKGSRRMAFSVETDLPGLGLEVDRTRTPEYLDVKLPSEPEVTPGGHRTWRLRALVPPNRARGHFPREEDPAYRDSAIYLKTVAARPHTVRVPVTGTANDR